MTTATSRCSAHPPRYCLLLLHWYRNLCLCFAVVQIQHRLGAAQVLLRAPPLQLCNFCCSRRLGLHSSGFSCVYAAIFVLMLLSCHYYWCCCCAGSLHSVCCCWSAICASLAPPHCYCCVWCPAFPALRFQLLLLCHAIAAATRRFTTITFYCSPEGVSLQALLQCCCRSLLWCCCFTGTRVLWHPHRCRWLAGE